MTFIPKARLFTVDEFAAYLSTLTWSGGWKPDFIVMHNSAEPSLKQWLGAGHSPRERMENLKCYYRDELHWHSGPHLFIGPDGIWQLCDLEADGVHASCFNKRSIGIEMVGDFNSESFTDGPGLEVQHLSVLAVAALHKALGIAAPDDYKLGVKGIHFHRECKRDQHFDCPGRNVDKASFVAAVKAAIGEPVAPAVEPVAPIDVPAPAAPVSDYGLRLAVARTRVLDAVKASEIADAARIAAYAEEAAAKDALSELLAPPTAERAPADPSVAVLQYRKGQPLDVTRAANAVLAEAVVPTSVPAPWSPRDFLRRLTGY